MSTGAEAIARDRAAEAVAAGLRYLAAAQRPDGGFDTLVSTDPALARGCVPDDAVFPNALIAYCLSFCPDAAAVARLVQDYLLAQMDRHGLWRHWPRTHPQAAALPPDLDDTSCASAALAGAGRAFPDNRAILLANRARDGRFRTWIVPRLGAGPAHRRATRALLARLPALWLFFRRTSAAPGDVDAVVNANALFYLGRHGETEAVAADLLAVLRDGREGECDKWYDNPFAVRYFLARALAGDAAAVPLVARTGAQVPADPFEAALAACALLSVGREPPARLIGQILAAQLASGAWPRAALYHGGRSRRSDGRFDAPHPDTPRWGSEALATAFAIEALSRLGTGKRG